MLLHSFPIRQDLSLDNIQETSCSNRNKRKSTGKVTFAQIHKVWYFYTIKKHRFSAAEIASSKRVNIKFGRKSEKKRDAMLHGYNLMIPPKNWLHIIYINVFPRSPYASCENKHIWFKVTSSGTYKYISTFHADHGLVQISPSNTSKACGNKRNTEDHALERWTKEDICRREANPFELLAYKDIPTLNGVRYMHTISSRHLLLGSLKWQQKQRSKLHLKHIALHLSKTLLGGKGPEDDNKITFESSAILYRCWRCWRLQTGIPLYYSLTHHVYLFAPKGETWLTIWPVLYTLPWYTLAKFKASYVT